MAKPVHSIYGASSSKRWMACPASVRASAGLPNPETPWAAEGTLLHDVAAKALIQYRGLGTKADIDWTALHDLTAEQIEVVRKYVDTIREDTEWGTGEPWDLFFIEQSISMPGLHPDFFGTADAAVIRRRRLTDYDLKCGAGVCVEVENPDGTINPQLGYYMLGVIRAAGGRVGAPDGAAVVELPPGVDELEIVVVQPRFGGVKRRMVAVTELIDLANDLRAAAILAATDNAPFKAGDHCKFCPAKRGADGKVCAALRQHARDTAKADFAPPPAALSNEDLTALLNEVEAIETYIQAAKEEAISRMRGGEIARGWGIRTGHAGNRTWIEDDEALRALLAWGLDIDLVAPRKIVTPAEAERLARTYRDEEIDVSAMVERKAATTSLVRTTPAEDFKAEPVAMEN